MLNGSSVIMCRVWGVGCGVWGVGCGEVGKWGSGENKAAYCKSAYPDM
jgi:hypothetical protein